MTTRSIRQLLAEHNSLLVPGTAPLKSWKRSRAALEERVAAIRPRDPPKKARQPGQSIRDFVEGMLQETIGDHPRKPGKPLGHPYAHVLEQTARAFPEAETSLNCIRWYATHLNRRKDVRLPLRERARPKKAA